MATPNFEEKILYKTHQHWIILAINILKFIFFIAIPVGILTYFVSYSWLMTIWVGLVSSLLIGAYYSYLWHHSWLYVGNQKITLSVRNGLWSQFAMNIRYRNIRDSAVSKNSVWGFLFKYGTIFVRSSANEWDFRAYFVPKVGKVYALVNALSRYTDEERSQFDSIEKLHAYHQKIEFGTTEHPSHTNHIDANIQVLENMIGVTAVVPLDDDTRTYISWHEEMRNHGIHEVLRRRHVLCFLHNQLFRSAAGPITAKNAHNEVYFPGVVFPEIQWNNVISGSPSSHIHTYLTQFFPYTDPTDATVLVGWDD